VQTETDVKIMDVSVRDGFAGEAMQTYISLSMRNPGLSTPGINIPILSEEQYYLLAVESYKCADALMVVKEKTAERQ